MRLLFLAILFIGFHTAYSVEYRSQTMKSSSGEVLVHIGTTDPGDSFHVFEPPRRTKVSLTAKKHGCTLAANAGFFSLITGVAIGEVVSEGQILQSEETKHPSFGTFTNGTVTMGYYEAIDVQTGEFNQLVTGAIWPVLDGKVNVKGSAAREHTSQAFLDLITPRTAIGVTGNGSIVVIVVDGEEKHYGASLFDVADILLDLGVISAINLDGGGSSDMVYHDEVVSNPTCRDTQRICERSVSTIVCIKDS